MPAYESKLTIAFGARREREEPVWDFVWAAGSAAPEGVPVVLAEATAAVGRDLLGSDEVRAHFPELDWAYRAADRALSYFNRRIHVFQEWQDMDTAWTTAAVAEAVSDQLTGYEFVQWPICPAHQHPMRATVVDEAAWWLCPKTNERVRRVGEL